MKLQCGIGTRTCARLLGTFAALAIVLVAAGCGSGGHGNIATPPPSGAFSNSSLSGTYIFSYSGTDALSGGSFLAIAGAFTANGAGGITGGAIDFDDSAGVFPRQSISGGSYNITPDGRGRATLNTSTPFGTITLDFVLSSGSTGLIIQFDGNGSGSGTVNLQASGITQSSLQGSYAFNLSGVDAGGNPLSTVGAFTLDASGNITAGLQDFNDNGSPFTNNFQPLALVTNTTVLVGSPGTAQLTASGSVLGTLNFDVWVIDATHLKFIETDSTAFLSGDAFVSTGHTAFPSGSLVFTMSGLDINGFPFAMGGLFSAASGTIAGGVQDINDVGLSTVNFGGVFSSPSGRPQVTFNGIFNGNTATGNFTFAAYPYNGGVQLLEIDGAGVTGGVAYQQSATSFNASQGSAMNLSGVNLNVGNEIDEIAEFFGTSLNGLYDVNNLGVGTVFGFRLGTGNISPGSNGRGTLSFPGLQTGGNTEVGALNFTFYVIDSSTAVLLEADTPQVALGSLALQSATQAPVGAFAHFNMVRSKAAGHIHSGAPRSFSR